MVGVILVYRYIGTVMKGKVVPGTILNALNLEIPLSTVITLL